MTGLSDTVAVYRNQPRPQIRPHGEAFQPRRRAGRHILVYQAKQKWDGGFQYKNFMKRLPGYDNTTDRTELVAFASLGSVGIALITLAVGDAVRFAEAREEIAASLSVSTATQQLVASSNTNHALTNVMHSQSMAPRS